MSRENPESLQEARHWRAQDVVERAVANEELMEATREGIEASRRGEKGVPVKQVQEEARRRRQAK